MFLTQRLRNIAQIKFIYITFFLFLLPIITCHKITIKFRGEGKEAFFINKIEGRECPNQIMIDDILKSHPTCKYKFPNKIVTIQINFDKNITNLNRIFANIYSIIEIDLSELNTSLIENMDYMFANCKSLIFANLSNIYISPEINMNYMFSNCLSLNFIDLTNVDISQIINKKNIFFNCPNLKLDNVLVKNNNKRYLGDNSADNNYCLINNFFNQTRTCKINLETANQVIEQELKRQSFMEVLIHTDFPTDRIISTKEENEIFTISMIDKEDAIQLGECENELKDYYHIGTSEELIIYKHEYISNYFLIPIIGFEVYYNNTQLDLNACESTKIEYKILVNITEVKLDIYNHKSDYYNDNCNYMYKISLYERKEYYNINNLSLCQKDCEYDHYDFKTQMVTCSCPPINSYINQNEVLLHKFELKESDKNKCILFCDPIKISNLNNCLYNGTRINQIIIEGLKNQTFRQTFIDKYLNNKNKTSIAFDEDIYTVAFTQYEENIQLGNCSRLLRQIYNISDKEDIIIYTYKNKQYDTIKYELFNINYYFNIALCENKQTQIPFTYNIFENITNFEQPQVISLIEFRNLISKNITSFVNSSSIIEGDNFAALILSSDDMDVKSKLEKGISAVDLGNCTEVIKSHYNIPKEENLIVLNIESRNNNSNITESSFNLGKNIQIEIYDNSGRQLGLSVCKEDIKLLMNIEGVEELNIETSKKYSEQGIDVFNPTDNFFNDLCHKYDNIDEIDIIIDDRRSDIYQNATFCQSGCSYNGVDYDLMAANCLCDSSILQSNEKNKTSDTEEEKEVLNFKALSKSFISSLLDFNIEVFFCYNLVFDTKILVKNIGFYCMLILNVLQIIFLCIFLIKKLKPIQNFMSNYSGNKKEQSYPPKKNKDIKNVNNVNINEIDTKIDMIIKIISQKIKENQI